MATTYYMSGISLIIQYLTNLGLLAAGGTLNTYVAGSVSTPVTTYTDSTGITPNVNPMTLSSAARPVSQSGAGVQFWVPGGTSVKLVVYDAQGNLLCSIDNVPAINDLTNATNSLQALLASPASSNVTGSGPVAGADLVANAVKSYDVFGDVRAANAPTLATGQTLSIEVQGAISVDDGLGGPFFWSSTATNTDDGRTVLKPNSVNAANPGRWIRLYALGVPQILVKTADQSVTSSTVLVADTTLSLSLGTGYYLISARLILLSSSGTTQGYKIQPNFSGSTGSALLQAGAGVATSNGTAAAIAPVLNSAITEAAISATNGDAFNFDFVLIVTATGTFQIQFAQNSSVANQTIMKAGSTLTVTRIA